ncbi:MAG: hypothetical protein H6878_10170 [Rhodobiaceae bacterium]|nr:hypothetical protein [Rhodobiaceae bacterium]MCC0042279.1 hypothetical protein [Rhodobiaceae bacterium]
MTPEDTDERGAAANATGDSLAALWRALNHQAARFERRMAQADTGEGDEADTSPVPPDAATAEKDARTLSVLVRAYESLSDLSGNTGAPDNKEADGGGPDIEALRRELAERLGRLCQDGEGWPDAGPAGDGAS